MLEWDPPHRFLLDWQIGEARGTEVEVRFSPEGPGARVELEHRGFSSGDPRERYSGAAGTSCSRPSSRAAQALDTDVDRLPGWAVAQKRGHELGEPPRREELSLDAASSSCVHQRIPVHELGRELLGREARLRLEGGACGRSTYRSTCPSQLAVRGTGTRARASRSTGPSSTSSSPTSSASSRTIACLVRLARVEPAAGRRPEPGVRELEALTSRIRSAGSRIDCPRSLPEPHSDSRNA